MRLSDGLKSKRADLLDRMEALSKTAGDANRLFTDDEARAWDAAEAEVKILDKQLERQLAAEALARGDRGDLHPATPGGPRLVDSDGNVIRALTKSEKLVDLVPRRPGLSDEPVSLARALRGIVLGDWSKANRIERAMGEGVLAGGGYAVPSELSAMWLDNARAASVCMQAGAITIPMTTSTLRIVRIDGDPTVAFRKEQTPIPESDLVFAGVDLKARTAGVLCRVSVELLEDSPIANAAIETAMSGAMGLAFDQAMLAGDGSQVGNVDNPTGLLFAAGVNDIPAAGALTGYDHFLDGYGMVLNANGAPDAWVMNPTVQMGLAKTATGLAGDKTQLRVPVPLDTLPKFVTTSLVNNGGVGANESASIIGDFDMLGLALRTGLTLEASRTAADVMSKVEVLIRLYARIDVAILRPKFFTRIKGITP
jgi:HK97 family phage major capsid protein